MASVNDAFVQSDANSLSYDKLHIEVLGDPAAPPVVLLHGWGSSAKLMSPVANALATEFFVHNVDLPGHGLSPAPTKPCGLPEQAELVRSYITDTFSVPVILFGHSNGGRISLYLASQPDSAPSIAKLVLVSPSGIRPSRGIAYYVKSSIARTAKFPARFLRGKLKDAVLDWLTHSLLWKLLGSSDYNALTGTMRESFVATVNYFVEDSLGNVKAPTLLFWGDKDTAVSLKQMKTIESLVPDCGLVILNGAGHYGYLDQPNIVFSATRFFLGSEVDRNPVADSETYVATDDDVSASDGSGISEADSRSSATSSNVGTTDVTATSFDSESAAVDADGIKTEVQSASLAEDSVSQATDNDTVATETETANSSRKQTPAKEKSAKTTPDPTAHPTADATPTGVTPRGTKAPKSKRRRKKAGRSRTGRQKDSK